MVLISSHGGVLAHHGFARSCRRIRGVRLVLCQRIRFAWPPCLVRWCCGAVVADAHFLESSGCRLFGALQVFVPLSINMWTWSGMILVTVASPSFALFQDGPAVAGFLTLLMMCTRSPRPLSPCPTDAWPSCLWQFASPVCILVPV
jgi:hypothetical protein